jgi:hypothetical protein
MCNRRPQMIVCILGAFLVVSYAGVTGGATVTTTTGGTTNWIPKFTGSSNIENSMIYQSTNDRIGIGTDNPQNKFHVSTPGNNIARFESTTPGAVIHLKDSNTTTSEAIARIANDLDLRTDDWPRLTVKGGTGYVGIGTAIPSRPLTVRGNILVERSNGTAVMELGDGLDYAEGFDVAGPGKPQPGTVLVIDSSHPGRLTTSTKAYDTTVAGIAAGANNVGSGVRLGVGDFDCDVSLAGRVYCNVDATECAVQLGDLLTTSSTAGYAMKAADRARTPGAVLGKAMQSLEKGKKGQILVLVTLQ